MMNLIIFIFFALLDAGIVGLCGLCYSGREKYHEGMILGIHVPPEAEEDEEVRALTGNYRIGFRRFQRLNLATGVLCPAFCFLNTGAGLLVWTLWILEYCLVFPLRSIVSLRKMYAIKKKHHWIRDDRKPHVTVDTWVSAISDHFPISWQWHLPALAAGVGMILFPALRNPLLDLPGGWIYLVLCPALPVFFLCFHLFLTTRGNRVFSQDTEVNEKVNRMIKRTWSVVMLIADYSGCLGLVWLCLRIVFEGGLTFWDYGIYAVADLVGAAAVITGILLIRQKRRDILSLDPHPLLTDDDEYWKNGWYSNPYDRHLFVEDRMNSSSYSLNMAHPAAKWWIASAVFICIAAVAVCIVLAVVLGDLDGSSPEVKITEDQVMISYSFYNCSFSADEIQSVELISELPEDDYDRVNGGDTDNVLVGYFEGEKTGEVMMFLIKDETPLIRIELPDQTVFLNSDADGQTEKWYEEINMLRDK